jgi:hypothetical protein
MRKPFSPLKHLLDVSVWAFIGSVLVRWCLRVALGYHDIFLVTMLLRPLLIGFLWLRYVRSSRSKGLRELTIAAGFLLVISARPRRTDMFSVIGVVSLTVIFGSAFFIRRRTTGSNNSQGAGSEDKTHVG